MYLTISQTYKNIGDNKFKTKLDKIEVKVGDVVYPRDLNFLNNQEYIKAKNNCTCIRIKDITDNAIKFTKENDKFVLMAIIGEHGNTNTDLQHLSEFELLFGETLFIDASTKSEYRTICIDKF